MPKTLLEQSLRTNDVPVGTIEKGKWKSWTRLQRPKQTKCPFGEVHATKRNVLIRAHDCGYKVICMADRCKGKSFERDTNCGYSTEEEEEGRKSMPTYTADMF